MKRRICIIKYLLSSFCTEIYSGNKASIDAPSNKVTNPLFRIEDEESFNRRFFQLKSKFKEIDREGIPLLSEIHCYNITSQLEEIQKSRQWKRHIPGLRRSMAKLDLLLDRWVQDDAELYRIDQEMMSCLNSMMDEIHELKMQNKKKAYLEFRKALRSIEPHVKRLNVMFEKMRIQFAR